MKLIKKKEDDIYLRLKEILEAIIKNIIIMNSQKKENVQIHLHLVVF